MSQLRNPFYAPEPAWGGRAGRPRVRFGHTELGHLALAVAVLTLAFALFEAKEPGRLFVWPSGLQLLGAFLAVSSGFVLHELAHKVLAQRYGHWAEFRAEPMGLGIGLLLALMSPLFFAAPGAVFIRGQVTMRENGLISLVGPSVNMVLALAAAPFSWAVNAGDAFPTVMGTVARINAILAIFNMLPFGPIDGRKVWHWSKPAFVVAMAAAIGIAIVVFAGPRLWN